MVASLISSDLTAVAAGAILGALSRFQVGKIATEWIAHDPSRLGHFQGWHTAGINIAGSFVLGGIAGSPVVTVPPKKVGGPPTTITAASAAKASVAKQVPSMARRLPKSSPGGGGLLGGGVEVPLGGLTPRTKLLFGVGFCGSFTTFSTYSVDVVAWLQQGNTSKAVSYVMVNNIGGILAAGLGMVLAKEIFGC